MSGPDRGILLIEDNQSDFERIHDVLTLKGHNVLPAKEAFYAFRNHFRTFLDSEIDQVERKTALDRLEIFLQNPDLVLIILDIGLFVDEGDKSGIELLQVLRGKQPLTPILVLTVFEQKEVADIFRNNAPANYYLHKKYQGYLSDEFFSDKLCPTVSMLLYWQMIYVNADIRKIIETRFDMLESALDENFGLLRHQLTEGYKDIGELRTITSVTLRAVQHTVSKDSKKAEGIIDNLIKEFELCEDIPKIGDRKSVVVQMLRTIRTDLVKILKGEIARKDLADYLKEQLKTVLDLEEDDNLTIKCLELVLKAVKRGWKYTLL